MEWDQERGKVVVGYLLPHNLRTLPISSVSKMLHLNAQEAQNVNWSLYKIQQLLFFQ